MKYLQWIIILGFIAYLGYKIHPAIKKAWRKFNKKKEVHHRMLAAVRRREAGLSRFLQLGQQEQRDLREQLDHAWKNLHAQWKAHAVFSGGFSFSEKGLSLQAEGDWSIMAFYDIASFEEYMHCKNILESEEFHALRNHCDIRLAIGKRWLQAPDSIADLF